jgi:hypothetical protein
MTYLLQVIYSCEAEADGYPSCKEAAATEAGGRRRKAGTFSLMRCRVLILRAGPS